MEAAHGIGEKRFEKLIGAVLRGGVILAATIAFVGGVLYLLHGGAVNSNYQIFHGEPSDLRQVQPVVADAAAGHARALIQLGLLILIATPVARVALSVVAYFSERDWLYTAITVIVLAILIYSLTSA
jgi:uncharacterized membrane protein